MPGFYGPGRYDLAGFCVAVVEEDELIDPARVQAGDRIVAVASSGVHSNGFSLVRRILEMRGVTADTTLSPGGPGVLDALLEPTVLYVSLVQALLSAGVELHGMAHITGGGLPENLPRALPAGVHARLDAGSWERPALFRWLQENGEVPEADLWNTFNLGVGFCLVLPEAAVESALAVCRQQGHQAWLLGAVEAGAAPNAPLAGLPY
jgi:phosphoribosylformylglycinamidine cyclo-ligase